MRRVSSTEWISSVTVDGKTHYTILKGFRPDRPIPKAGCDTNPNYAADRAVFEQIMANSVPAQEGDEDGEAAVPWSGCWGVLHWLGSCCCGQRPHRALRDLLSAHQHTALTACSAACPLLPPSVFCVYRLLLSVGGGGSSSRMQCSSSRHSFRRRQQQHAQLAQHGGRDCCIWLGQHGWTAYGVVCHQEASC
jgi:hypothetical protein